MSTHPRDLNLDMQEITEHNCRPMPARNDQDDGGRDFLLEAVVTATSEIESEIATGALASGAALGLVATRVLNLIEASGVAIGLVEGSEVVCRASAGTAPDVGARIEIEKGLSGECIRTGKVVRCDDTVQDARVDKAACEALNLRSAVLVPIRDAGQIIGVFEVLSDKPFAFDDWAQLAVSHIAHFVGGLANARLDSRVVPIAPAKSSTATAPLSQLGRKISNVATAFAPSVSSRRLRKGLVVASAAAITISAGYRVREMVRSARPARQRAEMNAPALTAAPVEQNLPVAPPPEPEIAKEDGRPPEASTSMKPSAALHAVPPALPTASANVSPPRVQVPEPNGIVLELEIAPEPPAVGLVQPAADQGATVAPLMNVPVVDPNLAGPQPAALFKGPQKSGFVSRVLGKPKKLIEKIPDNPSRKRDKKADHTSEPETEPQPQEPSPQSP